MINWILDPRHVLFGLIALAVITPIVGLLVARRCASRMDRRFWLVMAWAGPVVLAFWGVHNLVLRLVGFDSILSALIVISIAMAGGYGAGRWIKRAEQG